MARMKLYSAHTQGKLYLNLGCGEITHSEWLNIDQHYAEGVLRHDLRKALPFDQGVVDAIYSSHVLEHLPPTEAKRFLSECYRVMKPNGIVRIVVPDLEKLCTAYLAQLQAMTAAPSRQSFQRYRWVLLCLFDQMVRDVAGGHMLKTLREGEFDADFTELFSGDEIVPYLPYRGRQTVPNGCRRTFGERLRHAAYLLTHMPGALGHSWFRAVRNWVGLDPGPRRSGEAHRWMYDRVSLRIALEEAGFGNFRICQYDESLILGWESYNFDRSFFRDAPRKPDSLFAEALKPSASCTTYDKTRSTAYLVR
jgi:predicted SAM-dependent methyltransferase